MQVNFSNIVKNIAAVVVTVFTFGLMVSAQSIDSTDALKLACETSPNNTVVIDYPAKVNNGGTVEFPATVNAGCTISLTPSGSFETDQIGISFNGQFAIQSNSQTQVKIVKSALTATSMNLTTAGNGSYLGISESLLKTTEGDFNVSAGFQSVVEIALPLSGSLSSIESSGGVSFTGGSGKFEGSVLETQILAMTGITVSMGGAEGIFKTDRSNLVTANGAVTISSQGSKSLVEMAFGEVRAANGINVTLPGSEGNLVWQDMRANSGVGSIAIDVARFGSVGKIGVFGSVLNSGAGVSLLASLNGRSGLAALENTAVTASNNVVVQTGRVGETLVKTSNINSLTSIVFRNGIGGKCLSDQNVLVAPFIRACR